MTHGDAEEHFADGFQMACNFLAVWRRGGEDRAIDMHCEMADLDGTHLWRLIAGLASYAIVAEAAVLILRGACDEDDLRIADADPTSLAMVRAVLRHLVRGPVGGQR